MWTYIGILDYFS